MERSPTRRQHFQTRHLGQQIGDDLGRIDDPLEVIQDEEQVLVRSDARQTIHEVTALAPHARAHPR